MSEGEPVFCEVSAHTAVDRAAIFPSSSVAPKLVAGGAEAIAIAVCASPVLGIPNVLNGLVPRIAIGRPALLKGGITDRC